MSRRTAARSKARAAARLAATQALYQHEMEGMALAPLLHEFHQHRLGATIEDAEYAEADDDFFDDIVTGTLARPTRSTRRSPPSCPRTGASSGSTSR